MPNMSRSAPNESMAQRNAGAWQWLTVVPQPVNCLAGRLRGVRRLPRHMVVRTPRNHRQHTAEMRADDLHGGIPLQVPGGDQLHGGDGVLKGYAHHPRDVMLADQR